MCEDDVAIAKKGWIMNSIQNYYGASFKGSLIIKDKNGDRTLIPASEVKSIEEKTSGLSKGTYIVTNIDDGFGSTFYRFKNVPYEKVVDLYKKALNSNDDVEIPSDNN